MKSLLDDAAACRRHDPSGMLEKLARLPDHMEQALDCAQSGARPGGEAIDQVLLCGMGGSAIGGDLVRAWLGARLKAPLTVHRSPVLPAWVGARTLALLVSYSGDTRETLAGFEQARAAGARLLCVSTNGGLEKRAREAGAGFVRIPGGLPPRAAVAFTTVPLVLSLHLAGLAADPRAEVRAAAAWLRERERLYAIGTPEDANPAKTLARRLRGRLAVVYGSQDRLSAVATRWAGQIGENAKQLCHAGAFPEMTHNDVVGWKHPAAILRRTTALFLRDRGDPPLLARQVDSLTRLSSPQMDCAEVWTEPEAPWPARLWDLLWRGDYVSLYLAFLNREDPTPVEAIDRLKSAVEASILSAESG